MEGITLSVTTTLGGIFFLILIVLKAFYWSKDAYQDCLAPEELDNEQERGESNQRRDSTDNV